MGSRSKMLHARVDQDTTRLQGKLNKRQRLAEAERTPGRPITDPNSRKARKRRFMAFIDHGNKRFGHRISERGILLCMKPIKNNSNPVATIPHYAKVVWDRAAQIVRIFWKGNKECWYSLRDTSNHR